MNKWLLLVVGVVFFSVLFDLLYPNGKTNRLCKSIFGIISIGIIISPILNLNLDAYSSNLSDNSILVENLNSSRNNYIKSKIEGHLKSKQIEGVNVEIDSNLNLNEYEIKNIYVDITNLVLTENVTNINKYEVIQKEILGIVDISKERIIIYG